METNDYTDMMLLCKKNAMRRYLLEETDFDDIEPINKNGVVYYEKDELIEKAIDVHGSLDELHYKKYGKYPYGHVIQETKRLKLQNQLQLEKQRKEELISELAECGLEFREDSMVCNHYIKNGSSGKYDKYQVVLLTRELEFLNNKTDYRKIYRKNKIEFYKELSEYGDRLFPDEKEEEEERLRNEAKKEACVSYLNAGGDPLLLPFSLEQKYDLYAK